PIVGWMALGGKTPRAPATQAGGEPSAPMSFTYDWGRKTAPARRHVAQSMSWWSGLQYEERPSGNGDGLKPRNAATNRAERPLRSSLGPSAPLNSYSTSGLAT